MAREVTRMGNSLGLTLPADFIATDDDQAEIANMDNDAGEITFRLTD